MALFAEHGYDHVTVADICAAAQIAPRTFFRYFPSKDDVLAEPMREMTGRLTGAIDAAPPGTPDAEVLRAALRDLAAYVVANRQRLTTFAQVARAAALPRSSPLLVMADRVRELSEQLAGRRGADRPTWQDRLLVARTLAAYRIWFEDLVAGETPADPLAHLDDIFATP